MWYPLLVYLEIGKGKNKMKQTIKNKIARLALGAILAVAPTTVNAQSFESSSSSRKTQTNSIDAVISQESSLVPKNFSMSLGYHSLYMGTYGFTMSDNEVMSANLGFEIGKMSYIFMNNYDPVKGWNESAHMVATSIDTKHFSINPDAIVFTSPAGEFRPAITIGLGIHTKNLPLDLSIYGTHAIGNETYGGQLYQLRAGKTIPLKFVSEKLSLGIESRLTYNNRYFVNDSGLSTVALGANLNYNLGKGYSLDTGIRAQKALNSMGDVFKDHRAVFDFSFTKKF
jgi:hypothetical protein